MDPDHFQDNMMAGAGPMPDGTMREKTAKYGEMP
jgi:hypothetical protein